MIVVVTQNKVRGRSQFDWFLSPFSNFQALSIFSKKEKKLQLLCKHKSYLCAVWPVYGFKWRLKTLREKNIRKHKSLQSFQHVHTRVSIGPGACRQCKVVTMCLVRLLRHTSELSVTVIGSFWANYLCLAHSSFYSVNENEITAVLHVSYSKPTSCVTPLRLSITGCFTTGSHKCNTTSSLKQKLSSYVMILSLIGIQMCAFHFLFYTFLFL